MTPPGHRNNPKVVAAMQDIGKAVEGRIPDGYGFFVFVAPFNDESGDKERANYVSNMQRADAACIMEEFIRRNPIPKEGES